MIYRLDSAREPAPCFAADDVAYAYRNAYHLLFPGSTVRLVGLGDLGPVVEIVSSNQTNRDDIPPVWVPPPPGQWRISYLTWQQFHKIDPQEADHADA